MAGQIKLRNIHAGLKTWLRAQNTGYGMAVGSRTIFVDKVNGSDSYSGFDDPASALATVEAALALATNQDVIYIAPGGAMSGGDPVAYQTAGAANHVIAKTQYGLAMVGLTHSGLVGFPMDPQIKIGSAIATPIITCYAPYCAFENLAFNTGGSNSYPALRFLSDSGTSTANANNESIFNCYFRNAGGTGAGGSTGGAIYIEGGMGFNIQHCMFYNCRHGISAKSGTDVCENLFISDVVFLASAATVVSSDIYMYFQGQNYSSIDLVRIQHPIPTYPAGHGCSIICAGGTEAGILSRVFAEDAAGTCHATTGTIFRGPTTFGIAMIYAGGDVLKTI